MGAVAEKGLRSSTRMCPGIVGMGMALEIGLAEMEDSVERIGRMRDHLVEGGAGTGGEASSRQAIPIKEDCATMPTFLPGYEGEMMVLALDQAGFCLSPGSSLFI